MSMGVISFHIEEFNDILLLHMHFHVRHSSVRLPLCCHLLHSNKMQYNTGEKVQPSLESDAQKILEEQIEIKGLKYILVIQVT